MNYRLGLYEKSMPAGLTWREMLAAGHAAGFDQLEISIDESDARLAQLDWTDQQKLELLATQVETGMSVRTMCLSGHRKYRDMDFGTGRVDFPAGIREAYACLPLNSDTMAA